MILLIDNYDSFTYNLYQLVGTRTRETVSVVKNDAVTPAAVAALHPSALVLSPGPGRPEAAANMPAIIHAFRGKLPMFGVCLGMQALGQEYGGQITAAPELMHGREDHLQRSGASVLLAGIPEQFTAARYHSLVVSQLAPTQLQVTATGSDGSVMAIENPTDRVFGVQFHPESIMTSAAVGQRIIDNFLAVVAAG